MDVRNNLDALRSLLGVNSTGGAAPQPKSGTPVSADSDWDADRTTLSSAANGLLQASAGEGVRADKVASVQAALAAGTYSVPSSAVASKLVDSMLLAGF